LARRAGVAGCAIAESETSVSEEKPPRLAVIRLLAALSPAERSALEQRCSWRRYRAGHQIVARQSDDRDMFFVVEGRVRVVDYSLSGREVIYATIGRGGHFGELAAIDGRGRSASVVAIEDCQLASITPTDLESLLRRHPNVALALLRDLVEVIRTSDERITDLSTLGAMQRICRELLRLAQPGRQAGGLQIARLPTQSSIAAQTGTTRETVARTLAQLADDGLIQRSGRRLRIPDRAGLEALIEQLPPAELLRRR
jgi:CRP/FNR family cyclic AMP-dependent transcriptional regulator